LTPELEILWRVQDLDRALTAVRERRGAYPGRRTALASRLADARALVTRAEEAGKARALAKRDAEKEAEGLVAQERKFQTQLTQVKKNDEYAALLAEIAGAQQKRSALETFVLEKMEEEGAAAAEVARAKQALALVTTQVAAETAVVDAEEAKVKGEEDALVAQREDALAGLPAVLRARYERVPGARAGQAVAALVRDSCGVCGARLPPQAAIEVRRGAAVVECPDCGRMLLYKPE